LYLKNYSLAAKCFERATFLDSENSNAGVGLALSYSKKDRHQDAIRIIDDLATEFPDNYRVLNTKGIVYKDVGLFYKNSYSKERAEKYFKIAAIAFLAAQKANEHLQNALESNRALTLFFLDESNSAKDIWLTNNELSSQNNLALYYANNKEYKKAYNKLDNLYTEYRTVQKKKHEILEYNRGLARSRTRLNNNYKFITNYFLTEEKPSLAVENPFQYELSNTEAQTPMDFILAYSDEECSEEEARKRKKIKKKRRFRLFKRKKKKFKGDCPTF